MKKRKDGRYHARMTLPNGAKLNLYGKTIKEVQAQVDATKVKYAMGTRSFNNKITISEWAQTWWEADKKKKVGPSCEVAYLNALNKYILPEMGHLLVSEVRPIDCQWLLNSMDGKSQSLQKDVKIVLNGMFKYAVINSILAGNPAQYLSFTVPADKKRMALAPEQVNALLEISAKQTSGLGKNRKRNWRAELLVHLALYCGLRRGEIIALKWEDIVNGKAHIHGAVSLVNNQAVLKAPKSEAGNRKIPIPEHLQKMLEEYPRTSEYVVPSAKGTIMSKTAFVRMWKPIQNECHFKMVFHQLRHTYATMLHKLGVDPKMMQYLMGHANLDMSLGTYTDIQEEQIDQATNKMTNIYDISIKII